MHLGSWILLFVENVYLLPKSVDLCSDVGGGGGGV